MKDLVPIIGFIAALVLILVFYFANTTGKTASTDQRLSEFRPATGVVCYAFPGVPQSLSCVRETP